MPSVAVELIRTRLLGGSLAGSTAQRIGTGLNKTCLRKRSSYRHGIQWLTGIALDLAGFHQTTRFNMQDAYSIPELVELGPASRSTLYIAISQGRLIAHKLNRRTIVLRRDWEAFLDDLPTVQPASKPTNSTGRVA